jgi:hypothetical protein
MRALLPEINAKMEADGYGPLDPDECEHRIARVERRIEADERSCRSPLWKLQNLRRYVGGSGTG